MSETSRYYNSMQRRDDDHSAEIRQLKERLNLLSRRFTAPIVCICGSTKFKQAWISENARLTGLGNIVLSVGLWGHHERIEPDEETKKRLDDLHKRKIDLCDWVWVLDVGGYIGSSTKSEIEYANAHLKPVRFLSLEFPNYTEPEDPIKAKDEEIAALKRTLCVESRRELARQTQETRDEIMAMKFDIANKEAEIAALKDEIAVLKLPKEST